MKMTTERLMIESNLKYNNKYDYSLTEYINPKTKVLIICKIHGAFEKEPYSHLNGQGCTKCSAINQAKQTRLDKDIFETRSNKIHNNKYTYEKSDYVNNRTKLIITCPIHGDFTQIPINHWEGSGCTKCWGDIARMSLKDFSSKSNVVHNFKYNYSKVQFNDTDEKIIIICPTHGEFTQTANSHLYGKGCMSCCKGLQKEKVRESGLLFISKSNEINCGKYKYDLIEYKRCDVNVEIICPIHGAFLQLPKNHLKGFGCNKCNTISTGEKFIVNYLDKNNINYKFQYSILINDNRFYFDFYLECYNLIIEFDGEQHYKFVEYLHKTQEKFLEQQERDEIKNQYCRDNSIDLVRISFKDKNRIANILEEKMKQYEYSIKL